MDTPREIMQVQLAENLRYYGDMRFKQLTLFTGAMTVLGAALDTRDVNTMLTAHLSSRFAISAAGLMFTSVIWVMEVKSTVYWVATRESENGKDLWPRPKDHFLSQLNSTNAVLFMYIVSYCFWLVCARSWSYHPCLLLVIGTSWLVVLMAFTARSYKHMWLHKE